MILSEIDATNFFVAGGTLRHDSPSYVKRPADDELFKLAMAGEFCYVLTARQMGKSSLMIRTAQRLQEAGASSVIIDLTKIGTDVSVEQWYLGLITQLKRRLHLSVDPMAWWKAHFTLGYVQRFTDFLYDIVLSEIEGQVVIFMDEIDTTLNLNFSDDFFAAIRFIYNARATDPTYNRLTFVLLGVATPADLIKNRKRTPFNIGQGIDLSDFSRADTHVLKHGLEAARSNQAEAIFNRIFYWTHGHPYLTQKLCLIVAEIPNSHWTDEQVDQLVENLFLSKEARKETNLQFVRDSVASSPQKGRLLKLYQRVYKGKTVADDERSILQNQLKLFGLVRVEAGQLKVRNEIYRRVFNDEWIKDAAPVDWTRRFAVSLTVVVLLLSGLIGFYAFQQKQQSIDERAQGLIDNFRGTTDPEIRLTNLAGLFELPDYKNQARDMFYEDLTPEERLALFELTTPQAVGPALITVVKGLYTTLDNNERDNALLQAMAKPLEQVDDARASNLATEIEQWLQGRHFHNAGDYRQAVTVYSLDLHLNDRNPGLYLDRGLAYLALAEAERALADFETALSLDSSRQNQVARAIVGDSGLYNTLNDGRESYQLLAALVATPTPTHTPTDTPTPTPTHTATPMPTPTDTAMATPTSTATPIPTSLTNGAAANPGEPPTPTNMPPATATPTPRPVTVVYVQSSQQLHQLGLINSSGQEIDSKLHEFAAAPAVSPNGRQIAFFGESGISQLGEIYGEGNGIWLIDIQNRGVQLLHKIDHVKNINWSPDGTKLAFEVGPPGMGHQVMVIDAKGGRELSRFPGEQPAWAPDSQTLAIKACSPECGLWRINMDGREGKLLTRDGTDSYPAWSPDGQYLTFTSRGRTGDWELYRLTLADDTLLQLTDRSGTDVTPVFSPDGLEIYFRTDVDGVWQLRAISPDGANERLIHHNVGPSEDWGLARPGVY